MRERGETFQVGWIQTRKGARDESLSIPLGAVLQAQIAPIPLGGLNIQTFGMIGIAEGQTARLNVLNPGMQAPAATGILCSALLSFLDDQGATIKSETVTVAPGKAMMLDLDADTDLNLPVNERKQIRATIQIPPTPPASVAPVPSCSLFPTLEIFNRSSGKTQVIVTATTSVTQVVSAPR